MRANHTDDHLAAVAAVKCARGNAYCSTRHIVRGRRQGSSRRGNRHRVSKERWRQTQTSHPPHACLHEHTLPRVSQSYTLWRRPGVQVGGLLRLWALLTACPSSSARPALWSVRADSQYRTHQAWRCRPTPCPQKSGAPHRSLVTCTSPVRRYFIVSTHTYTPTQAHAHKHTHTHTHTHTNV